MSSYYTKLWDAMVITCSDQESALAFEKGIEDLTLFTVYILYI